MISKQELVKQLYKSLIDSLPSDVKVTSIEFEGPVIAIYTTKLAYFMENDEVIRKLAKDFKKRLVVRADPRFRMSEKEAEKIIRELVPSDAGIVNMFFDKTTGEVIIEALKVGAVIGKGGQILKQIASITNWRPKVLRAAAFESKIVRQVRELLYSRADERKDMLMRLGHRIHRDLVLLRDYRVRIVALGGFQEVGRSMILVQTKESNILLDCGIKPGYTEEYPYIDVEEFDLDKIDAIVITHAHLDHCGFLPYLFKYGYQGPVYCTQPTLYLMALALNDYVEVAEKEGKVPIYSKRDVQDALAHVIPLEYGEVTDVAPDVKLTLYPAGHILGSAIAHLHIGNGLCNIVYTSDFKFGKTRLLDKAAYQFPRVEVLIMESTYGGREDKMPSREETERTFIDIVRRTLERGGKVLIPVLSVGRAQEIMVVLDEAMKSGKLPAVPVFIEGLLIEATAIHTAFPEYLSKELQKKIYRDENPFVSEYFTAVTSPSQRIEIAQQKEPCIIMATSGMLTGGPVMEYFRYLADDPRNSIIFVSYQIEGTLGRRILDGLREVHMMSPEGKLEVIKVRMEVHKVDGFSGHSDRSQLLAYVKNIEPKPERIVLCHGERSKIFDLSIAIERLFRIKTAVLANLDAMRLR